MTQEHKDLLLKDISARLPYGVKFESENAERIYFIDTSDDEIYINGTSVEDVKIYLFPMSSMTEEQKKEYKQTTIYDGILTIWTTNTYDWLNANHFDYRGLIEKDLSIDCTNLKIY